MIAEILARLQALNNTVDDILRLVTEKSDMAVWESHDAKTQTRRILEDALDLLLLVEHLLK